MDIGVDISLYPLDKNFIPPIQAFIDRVNADGRFRVETNSLATQIFGAYDDVMALLTREMRTTFEQCDKAVFVMKIVGPFAPA